MERRAQRHFGGQRADRDFEIYNATYIGAGTNATGGRAFISREYAAPKVFNSIFTEFNAGGNIDDKSGYTSPMVWPSFRTTFLELRLQWSCPAVLAERHGRVGADQFGE